MKFAFVALICLAVASTVSAQTGAPTSIAAALSAAPNNTLSTLKAAVDAAGLTAALRNESLAYTIFAPTNQAFAAAIAALNTNATALLGNRALLTQILSYHVVPSAALRSTDLMEDMPVTVATLLGQNLTITLNDGNVTVRGASNSANVVTADLQAGQSIVHVIDAVLVPAMGGNSTGSDSDSTMGAANTPAGSDDSTTAPAASTAGFAGAATTAAMQTETTATAPAPAGGATTTPAGATSAAAPMAGLASGAAVAMAVLGAMLL